MANTENARKNANQVGIVMKAKTFGNPIIPCCGAKTRQDKFCKKPPLKGKKRCKLHGGASTGPRTEQGKARVAAAHFKHGKRSKRYVEQRKKIWAELREIERRMKLDGLI